MRCNRQSTAAVGARFWNRQERAWQRRTSTHRKHRRTVIVDSDQLRATGTGSRSGKARAFGEKRKQNGAMWRKAAQRRTWSASESAGAARRGQQQLERGSGRPAGHAPALRIDNSHRLQSRRSLVRGKEEPGASRRRATPPGSKPQYNSLEFFYYLK